MRPETGARLCAGAIAIGTLAATVTAIGASAADTDAIFAYPALQVDKWTSKYVPTYAYEFNDENAPERFLQPTSFPYGAAHESELQYLFGLPNLPTMYPGTHPGRCRPAPPEVLMSRL